MSQGTDAYRSVGPKDKRLRCAEVNVLGRQCGRLATVGDRCRWHDPNRERCEALLEHTGAQCTNLPMPGTVVCGHHGGTTPEMQRHIKFRLLAACEPALEVLNAAMQFADWPTAVRAALGILDRAGLGPHATLTIDDPAMRDLANLTPEARMDQMEQILHIMRGRTAARQAKSLDEAKTPDQVM